MTEWTFDATIENIPEVTARVDEQLEALDCPMKAQMQIDVAIDELFSNVANYAYENGVGSVTARFEFDADTREARISFIDSGTPYNPLEKDDPDVSLPPEERDIGGLGIYLVKKTMDALLYEYRDGRNIVTICKRI